MALFLEFLAEQWILVAALGVCFALFFGHESRKSGKSLTPQRAISLVNKEEGVFVDLRDHGEYSKGHIVGAINIPLAKLDERASELQKFQEKPVVLVCKMGQHSGAAGKKLGAQGYSQVYRMSGGMMEWTSSQLPLVK